MNVISLFDGMSCGRAALERAGVAVDNYYTSEIDKPAEFIASKNWPDNIKLGSVSGIHVNEYFFELVSESGSKLCIDFNKKYPNGEWPHNKRERIDLVIGGSPCQGFSFAGKQLNFEDPRSKLFFEYVRILKEARRYNPEVKFLLENVKMKKEYQNIISNLLGVQPIEINSALVSAQNRKRLYWTNINNGIIPQPEDKGVMLKDIVLNDALAVTYTERRTEEAKKIRRESMKNGRDFSPRRGKELVARKDNKSNCLTATFSVKEHLILTKKALDYMDKVVSGGRTHWDFKHHSDIRNEKSAVVVANFFKGVPYNVLRDFDCIRNFDPIECERLQTLPDNYTEGVSDTQRYKMIGNGWTVDVLAHIFKYL